MSHGTIIIGAGQASAVTARTLRRLRYKEAITIIGDELHLPYQRPPLSKEFLGTGTTEGLELITREWADQQDVTLRLGTRVTALDAEGLRVQLDDGQWLPADAIVLATGGRPRELPNVSGERVHYLRTRDDADRLREAASATTGGRAIVIGAGFIGSEVASTLKSLGVDVTVLEAAPVPFARQLGETVGEACSRIHARHGVALHTDCMVTGYRELDDHVEVETPERTFEGDFVVVGVGIVPNDELATQAGLETGNGVWVDDHCRTSAPGIYAIGDIANLDHSVFGTRIRAEHFDSANKLASVVAKNIAGKDVAFTAPHWVWSDQYDSNIQFVGHRDGSEELVLRGSPEDPSWSAFYMSGPQMQAAFAMNDGNTIAVAREVIAARAEIDPSILTDTTVELWEVLGE